VSGTRWREAARALPVLLVLLLAFGLLGPADAGRPDDRQPGGAATVMAPPGTAEVVAGDRLPQHVLARVGRTWLLAVGPTDVAAGGRRTLRWQPSLCAALVLAVAGVAAWRGRAPPRVCRIPIPR
jgi:hypothetical protein